MSEVFDLSTHHVSRSFRHTHLLRFLVVFFLVTTDRLKGSGHLLGVPNLSSDFLLLALINSHISYNCDCHNSIVGRSLFFIFFFERIKMAFSLNGRLPRRFEIPSSENEFLTRFHHTKNRFHKLQSQGKICRRLNSIRIRA